MLKVVYAPKQNFLPEHTDMQDLQHSLEMYTELETEEIFITLHYSYFQSYTQLHLICDVRLVSKLYKVPYLLVSRLNTCTERTDLAGKSQNAHSHFFSPLACSTVSAVLKDYHLH